MTKKEDGRRRIIGKSYVQKNTVVTQYYYKTYLIVLSLERAAIVKVTHAPKYCIPIPDIIILTIGPSAPSTLYAARSFSGNAIIIIEKNMNQYEAARNASHAEWRRKTKEKKKNEQEGRTVCKQRNLEKEGQRGEARRRYIIALNTTCATVLSISLLFFQHFFTECVWYGQRWFSLTHAQTSRRKHGWKVNLLAFITFCGERNPIVVVFVGIVWTINCEEMEKGENTGWKNSAS